MSWFTYFKLQDAATPSYVVDYSPVRRKIVFPNLSDNLKIGDWIHINIDDYDIGRLFYYDNGLIKDKVDQDSYLVVYETDNQYLPTYSIIVESNLSSSTETSPNNGATPNIVNVYNKNLWLKSVTNVEAGNQPAGNYYIYYHKDDIQYVEPSTPAYSDPATPNYVATTPPSGINFMASESGNSNNVVNFYSHEINAGPINVRKTSVSFLGDPETWFDQTSASAGAKAIGSFSGPILKLFAKKGPDYGKVKIKIVKVSASGSGQEVLSDNIEIDLYSSIRSDLQDVFSFDVRTLNKFSTYEEIYGDFLFEIEVLDARNQSSSGNKFTIEKYSYSKNFNLQMEEEEIKPEIAFKSIGGLK
jgi:hypothetical protein